MAPRVLVRATVGDHGEFRAYRLVERDELLLEVLREADGRAWQLRVPIAERAFVIRLIDEIEPRLANPKLLAFDADGTAMLGQAPLGPHDQLAAVVLAEGDERVLALWRRERLRSGWSWTIDVAIVPFDLGHELCSLVRQSFATLDEDPEGNLADNRMLQRGMDDTALQHAVADSREGDQPWPEST
ncbi:hypothetical protein [Benzoatithermus flavus]|uniref:Uncharacterized protein n=1 Tax=Benzoatithermus flavus TaxID=3108223 RepID=A0ABU8XRN9_9PROT